MESLFVVIFAVSIMISFLLVSFLLHRPQPKASDVIIDGKAETVR